MSSQTIEQLPEVEQVVKPVQTLAGLQGIDGTFVPRDALGPGIIREVKHGEA